MPVERTTTSRGFALVKIPFQDYRHTPERFMEVQESSLASERKLWLGPDELYVPLQPGQAPVIMERAHMSEDAVRALRDALTEWLDEGETDQST